MGIQINGNTDNISATDGGLSVDGFELNQTGVSTFHSHLHVADQIIHLDDANSKIRFPAADTITAETAGSERLRITSSGQIGVGINNPSSPGSYTKFLEVSDNNAASIIVSRSASGTAHKLEMGAFSGASLIESTGATSLRFKTNSTERLRITSSGEVKIMNTSGTVGLYFQSSSGAVSNFRAIGTNNQSLGYFFGNTERVRFDSSGRVLIGKTSGNHILDINASSDEIRLTKASTSDYTGIQLDRDASGNAGGYFGLAGNAGHYISTSAQHDIILRSESNLLFSSGGATERLRITSDGKFGFGTNSPDQTVHIHKGSAGSIASTSTSVLTLENSTTAVLQFLTPNNVSAQLRFGDPQDNGAGFIDYSHSTNRMSFGVYGPTRMQIDSSGRVLIGTTTEGHAAADELTISNTTSAADMGITLRSATNGQGAIYFSDGTSGADEYRGIINYNHTNNFFSFFTNATEKLRILTNGHLTTQGNNTGNPVGMELRNNNTAAYSHAELSLTSQNTTTSKVWCDVPNARLRLQYNGGSTVDIDQSGNIHVPSGSGISFSASGNFGTMDSEILDDYEEGYWTPTIGGHVSNGSSSYGNQKGSYVRVGGLVYLNWYISWTSTSASGQFRIHGLPFNSASTYGINYNITVGSMMFDSINVPYQYGQMVPYFSHSTNQLVFYSSYYTHGWDILSHDSYTQNGGSMIASITYRGA